MRAFALLLLSAPFLLAGCARPVDDDDFPVGYDMSTPPLVNPVYDDRELRPKKLDPNRKVSDQDCTQPIDHTQGNLRCK
jgi:hypothetical protein